MFSLIMKAHSTFLCTHLFLSTCSDLTGRLVLCSLQNWNNEAEATAQRWANTCSMNHSPASDRVISSKFLITPRALQKNTTKAQKKKHFCVCFLHV